MIRHYYKYVFGRNILWRINRMGKKTDFPRLSKEIIYVLFIVLIKKCTHSYMNIERWTCCSVLGVKISWIDMTIIFVLITGMDPNWRHIIPPLQHHVISEGHCIEDCTRRAFPRQGVNMFAIMMRTHMIGKEVRLRHIRNNVEYPSIAIDRNIDPNYQEFRRLPASVRVMPGDRLISECTYDSSSRDQITLGKWFLGNETPEIFFLNPHRKMSQLNQFY